jgi:hypothetical protein
MANLHVPVKVRFMGAVAHGRGLLRALAIRMPRLEILAPHCRQAHLLIQPATSSSLATGTSNSGTILTPPFRLQADRKKARNQPNSHPAQSLEVLRLLEIWGTSQLNMKPAGAGSALSHPEWAEMVFRIAAVYRMEAIK